MIKKVPFSKIKNHGFFRYNRKLWQKYSNDEAQVVRGESTGIFYDFEYSSELDKLVTPVNAKIVVEK